MLIINLNISDFTDICQIRLDFTLAVTPLPVTTTGVCTSDKFTITPGATPTTSAGVIPPVLCGTLTGHHRKYICIIDAWVID